jgi:hypothetical protein
VHISTSYINHIHYFSSQSDGMRSNILRYIVLVYRAHAIRARWHPSAEATRSNVREFDNLITFGDWWVLRESSETSIFLCWYEAKLQEWWDLRYLWNHGGNHIPGGPVLPFSSVDSDGGIIWDRRLSIYSNSAYNLIMRRQKQCGQTRYIASMRYG